MSGQQIEYRVRGMTCGGCARSLHAAVGRVAPDLEVDVSHVDDALRVRGPHEVEVIRRAVASAGFEFGGRPDR